MKAGGGPGFVPNPPYMLPPRQFDHYYAPADMLPLDNQPPPAYGRDASMGAHTSMQPQQSMLTKNFESKATVFAWVALEMSLQSWHAIFHWTPPLNISVKPPRALLKLSLHFAVWQNVQIPLSYAHVVVGTSGSHIS
ncbi:unnamed protein product [Ilex paraguariensis]|uniref:Uncharacterized protein n=1 Tax=Ilex paraguariensis TaxID=185542 RepID=A0ABC8S4V1_9AQUA